MVLGSQLIGGYTPWLRVSKPKGTNPKGTKDNSLNLEPVGGVQNQLEKNMANAMETGLTYGIVGIGA